MTPMRNSLCEPFVYININGSPLEMWNMKDYLKQWFKHHRYADEVIESLSFEKVEKFKYLGVTVTDTNDIREEIKSE